MTPARLSLGMGMLHSEKSTGRAYTVIRSDYHLGSQHALAYRPSVSVKQKIHMKLRDTWTRVPVKLMDKFPFCGCPAFLRF